MNGLASSARSPYEYGNSGAGRADAPTGKGAVDAFKHDMLTGLDRDAPRFGQPIPPRAPSASNVDLKDPIQVHLLTETALSDSKQYEILSQEDVDNLKKQVQLMTQRVDSTRANLAIQVKFRDAATSMAKLDGNDPGHDIDAERAQVERNCEELALELFSLEKKLLVPQRRLLEHTAGILQLTHKASKRRAAGAQNQQVMNGIPGSPESLHTYSQSRSSLDPNGEESFFDDSSMYQLDGMEGMPGRRKNAIEIPMKSPVREQLREENTLLIKTVTEMEEKLSTLNSSLRDTIVRFNPSVNNEYIEPPSKMPNAKPGDMLRIQLDYLETGLVAIQAEQETFSGSGTRGVDQGDTDVALKGLWTQIRAGFEATRQRRDERRRARTDKGLEDDEDVSEEEFDIAEDYTLTGFASRVQYLSSKASTLKEQRSVLKRQIKQQRELNNKSDAEKDEELARKQEQLEKLQVENSRAEDDAIETQKMLAEALQDLESARAAAVTGSQAQNELEDKEEIIQLLEKKLLRVEADAKRSKEEAARALELNAQLEASANERNNAKQASQNLQQELEKHKADAVAKAKQLKQNEDEMEELNMTLAELKTEVTIARAELDGAYGSRAERAADIAAIKNSAENVKLQGQIDKLKRELTGTLQDLENVTKETIGSERERTELEGKLDEALQAKLNLEAEIKKSQDLIAKLQEDLDGERLKAGGGKPSAGASMLSEQFRSTMREERKKFQEDLKEERARCRKLEEELSRLKRSQGPGKSPLSPR